MLRRTLVKSAIGLAAAALTAGAAWAAPELKVGFVYVGPVGDHGWTYQHDQGRLAVEARFGDRVEITHEQVRDDDSHDHDILRIRMLDGSGQAAGPEAREVNGIPFLAQVLPGVSPRDLRGLCDALGRLAIGGRCRPTPSLAAAV